MLNNLFFMKHNKQLDHEVPRRTMKNSTKTMKKIVIVFFPLNQLILSKKHWYKANNLNFYCEII